MNRNRRTRPLPVQMAEMAVAVPQVVAHRLTRLALADHVPSARDQREFTRMAAEKSAAFQEGWTAILVQTALAQQQLALGMMKSAMWPWDDPAALGARLTGDIARAGLGVLGHGLAPVHRRAMANARRLRTTKLRSVK